MYIISTGQFDGPLVKVAAMLIGSDFWNGKGLCTGYARCLRAGNDVPGV